MKKVFSVNTELDKVTGVQKVLMDIHHAVQSDYNARIAGIKPYGQVNKTHDIKREEYIQWKNPFMFHNSIVIVHERKLLLFFWILNTFLYQKIKIVYIHHSLFYNHKLTTILPRTIVSISDRVTENLISFFGAKKEYIHKIYNCVQDINPKPHKSCSSDKIRILYPARINKGKRQIEICKRLQGKIDSRIEILFVGTGPLYEEFKNTIKDNEQFKILGFRDDVYKLLQECDYMMLFSTHEGLPITLIEAAMCGTPIICNDVGGNCEIAHDKKNAFVVNEWEELITTLNNLPNVATDTYRMMSENSRRIYESYFTFDKFKENYLQLLKQIANEQ